MIERKLRRQPGSPEASVSAFTAERGEAQTTLLIVDQNSTKRLALARLAAAIGCAVETYASASELMTSGTRNAVVLINDAMDQGSAPEVIAAIANARHGWPVIAMSDNPELTKVVAAIKAGAIDYVPTPGQSAALERTLARTMPEAMAKRAANLRTIEAGQRINLLTTREREVLALLVTGISNKQMGRDLGISPRTVEIHRRSVLAKLSPGNAQQATMLYILAFGLPAPAQP